MALANARIHRGDTQGSLKRLLNAGATVFRLPINKKTFAAPKVPQRFVAWGYRFLATLAAGSAFT